MQKPVAAKSKVAAIISFSLTNVWIEIEKIDNIEKSFNYLYIQSTYKVSNTNTFKT